MKRSESFQEDGSKKIRPGTGRILPKPPAESPPLKTDSPRSRVRPVKTAEGSASTEDQDTDEMWRRDPRSADPTLDIDYFFQSRSGDGHTTTARSSQYDTYRPDSPLRGDSPITGRSSASLATNVLLGDTSGVVQAVRERRSLRETSHGLSAASNGQSSAFTKDHDSDSENGSFFAIVDGHGHWRNSGGDSGSRPGYHKSVSMDAKDLYTAKPPSAAVTRARADLSAVTKPLSAKPRERTFTVNKPGRQSSNIDLDASIASEHSESESILSTSTDYSYSETPSPKMSRKGSGGKGPLRITRPNRAFELRRAKADSDSEGGSRQGRPGSAGGRPTSAGSSRSSSTASVGIDTRKARPSSARDTARSDVSLGAAIVKKSRENAAMSSSVIRRTEPLNRTENGRGGVRPVKQTSLSSAPPVRRSPDPRELRSKSATPKAMGSVGLAVTGVNKSQPNSRSNSPRSQEYSAWKRRKGYDPRQAVADAKAAKTRQNKVNRMERAKSVGASVSQDEELVSDRWRQHHGRHDTTSSMSSDADFDGSDVELERTDEITRISAQLRSKVDAMAKSIQSDRVMGAADRSLVSFIQESLRIRKRKQRSFLLKNVLSTLHVSSVRIGYMLLQFLVAVLSSNSLSICVLYT